MSHKKVKEKILIEIIKKRREIGFSQEYIAECLGMGQANYCKIESGVRSMKIETLFHISKILEIDLIEILGEVEVS